MSTKPPSEKKLENDIAEARERLARTIDELTVRAAPKNVAARQAESAKQSFYSATRTPEGDLRMERVAVAVAVVGAMVLVKVLNARRRERKWARQRDRRSW